MGEREPLFGEGVLGAQPEQPQTPEEIQRIRASLLEQWQLLPPDEQRTFLVEQVRNVLVGEESNAYRCELATVLEREPIELRAYQVFDAVIENLRSNIRANHRPTILEGMLEIFRSRLGESVEPEEFYQFFDVSYGKKQAVSNSIARLNRKLKPHGIGIVGDEDGYRVIGWWG